MPFIGGITLGMVAGAIALVVLVLFGSETVRSVRQARRHPVATAEALRQHDRAAGSLGRASAIGGYVISVVILAVANLQGHLFASLPLWIGAVAGLVVLMVVEQRWPAPGGTVRTADLQPRRVADVLPRPGTWIAGVAVLLAVTSIVVCGVLGAARVGGSSAMTATADWPSWLRTAPSLIGLGVVVAFAVAAVTQLLRRPALAGFERSTDLAYRRSGADRALRVVSVVGFWVLAVVLNSIEDAGFEAIVDYGWIKILTWASFAAGAAALISIPAFRAHPPKSAGPPAIPVPAAP